MRALRCPAALQAARQLWASQQTAALAEGGGLAWGAVCSCSGSSGGSGGSSSSSASADGSSGFATWANAPASSRSSHVIRGARGLSTAAPQPAGGDADAALAGAEAVSSEALALADALAAAEAEAQRPRPWHWVEDASQLSSSVITATASADLGPANIGDYYPFDPSKVPEAFQPFHQAFYPPRPQHLQRKGGCRGLQAEFAASGGPLLMWRCAEQEVADLLDDPTAFAAALAAARARGEEVADAAAEAAAATRAAGPPRVLLRGPAGTGKSVAVAALAERARARGEVVLYIPDARALISGGFFYKRPGTDKYDTIISAQHILKSVLDSHRPQLEALPLAGPLPRPGTGGAEAAGGAGGGAAAGGGGGGSGGSLLDLVMAGLSTDDDASLAVRCCLALVDELAAASAAGAARVLFAIDNYSALTGTSDYGVTATKTAPGGAQYLSRRRLEARELALASGMRLLMRRDLGGARVLAALSATGGAPQHISPPLLRKRTLQYDMPRFSQIEVAHTLHYYHERGLGEAPSAAAVEKLRAVTNGSGADLRRLAPRAAQLDTNAL